MNEGRLMSDGMASAEVLPASPLQDDLTQTAGGRLRLAREAAGLHIGALAVALKVPVKKLEALENDRIDLLPDAVFARALASSVCRTLKIDPVPILADLPQTTLARLVPETLAGGDTYRELDQGSRRTLRDVTAKPFVVIGLLLAAAAAGIAFFPGLDKTMPVAIERPAPAIHTGVPMVETQLVAVPTPVEKDLNIAALVNVETKVLSAPTDFKSDQVATLSVVAAVPALAPTASAPANTANAVGILVLKTKGASWVEVTDAGGVVQLRKTMVGGETVGVSGGLPLSVIVGKADTTEVQIRGKTFDMAPITKDNVARFEVR